MSGKPAGPLTPYHPPGMDRLALGAARVLTPVVESGLIRTILTALHRRVEVRQEALNWGYAVTVTGDATVDHLQEVWDREGPAWSGQSHCRLDLSRSRFTDAAGLVYLVARLRERGRLRHLQTSVRLPATTEQMDFLRSFKFPSALADALGKPLSEVLTPDSLFRLASPTPSVLSALTSVRPTLPANQFPLEMLTLGNRTRHVEAVQYAHRWLSKHVLSALDRDLADSGGQVARAVVLEALMAASTSSGAPTALVAAHYGLRSEFGPGLQIAVWWDAEAERTHGSLTALEAEMLAMVTDAPGAATTDVGYETSGYEVEAPLSVLAEAVTLTFRGRLDLYRSGLRMLLDAPRAGAEECAGRSSPVLRWSRIHRFPGSMLILTIPFQDRGGTRPVEVRLGHGAR
jgi:ABC-type transporter Mla MlaB component